MGWHVKGFEGEYVDVEHARTEQLQELLDQLKAEVEVSDPAARSWHEADIDAIEEELDAREVVRQRTALALGEDLQEMVSDDAHLGAFDA